MGHCSGTGATVQKAIQKETRMDSQEALVLANKLDAMEKGFNTQFTEVWSALQDACPHTRAVDVGGTGNGGRIFKCPDCHNVCATYDGETHSKGDDG